MDIMEEFSTKDDHRKAVAVVIMVFIAFVYVEAVWKPYWQPQQKSAEQLQQLQDTQNQQDSKQKASPIPNYVETPQPTSFTEKSASSAEVIAQSAAETVVQKPISNSVYPNDLQIKSAGEILVETEKLKVRISLLGGRIVSLELKDYLASLNNGDQKLQMVKHIEYAPLPLGVYLGTENDAHLQYSLMNADRLSSLLKDDGSYSFVNTTKMPEPFILVGRMPDGREIKKTLLFSPTYFLYVFAELSSSSGQSDRLALEWTQVVNKEEASILDPYDVHGYVWYDGTRAYRQPFQKITVDEMQVGDVSWLAMGDKYFLSALTSQKGLQTSEIRRTSQLFRARMLGDDKQVSSAIFCGPKSYELLQNAGKDLNLQLSIDFGKTGIICAPLLWLLHWFFSVFGNYGLAIVCLTIVVRMAVYPLNAASFKQMKAMQDLKPEMDRIKDEITDKQQQQIEMMALYKKKGVNPLGGCIPVAIQLPIFIGLFSALRLSVELRHAPYALWINDLSAPEKLMIGSVGVPVMVILFIISMLVQQWTTPSSLDPTQKKVMMVMPIVMGFMFANFPSGLTLYWLTSNLISIGQQKAMQRYDSKAVHAARVTGIVCLIVFAIAYLVSLL